MAQVLYAIIVLLVYRRTVAGLIAFAELVIQKMTGNTNFPTATSTLTAATSALTAYQSAVASTKTTKGLNGQRSATKSALLAVLRQLRDIVRVAAEASPENASTIVLSAGMTLKQRTVAVKALINVLQSLLLGKVLSGSVVCNAKSPGIPASYFWSYSLDQKVWTSVPMTLKSKVTISGLTPGQTYYFRYYTVTRKGTSDPSQVFSLLVK
jgi:hypothetical protein